MNGLVRRREGLRRGSLLAAAAAVAAALAAPRADGACYVYFPSTKTVSAAAGSGSIRVYTDFPTTCTTFEPPTSNAAWLQFRSHSHGPGPPPVIYGTIGWIYYDYDAAPGCDQRIAQLTDPLGVNLTLTQEGNPAVTAVSPNPVNAAGSGGSYVVTVTGTSGCSWSASTTDSWITITGGSGSGSGSIQLAVAANPTCTARSGSVSVGGTQTVTVNQQAGSPAATLLPSSTVVPGTGAAGSFSVSYGIGCAWTATSNVPWITITAGSSGTGSGTVSYSVARNPDCNYRLGTITAAGKTFGVSQGAGTGDFAISPTARTVGRDAGSTSVAVSAGASCAWTAASGSLWVSVSPTSGSGPGAVTVSWDANGTFDDRTGHATIAGQTFTLLQYGQTQQTCTSFSIAPASANATSAAGSQLVTLTGSPASCVGGSWSAAGNGSWLSVSPSSGEGPGTVTVSWTENTGSPRTGSATIAGRTFTVVQSPHEGACASSATTLCLLGDRFRVSAQYVDYAGNTGLGQAVRLTPDTGYFWFFSSANVEVVAKMVSFCGSGGSNVGVYANGLTDLAVTLTVTDTASGLTRSYANALGTRFKLIRDGPFACASSATAGEGEPEATAGGAEPWPDLGGGWTVRQIRVVEPGAACTPDATSLCLLADRFRVTSTYRDYGGGTGAGKAVSLTSDTGYFWFFDSANVEVVAKMVSFCATGGNNVGVYANGLTDVEVALTVTDTSTGLTVVYWNPLGKPFELIREGPFTCP